MLSKKRGISSNLVMIVVMVASIVLATGVVVFGVTLFQQASLIESIAISEAKMWVYFPISVELSWGAFAARNNGDSVLSIDRIVIRGSDVPFKQWYADTDVTIDIIQQRMIFPGWAGKNGQMNNSTNANCTPSTAMEIVIKSNANPASDGWFCGARVAGPIGLEPGQAAIIYYQLTNGTINASDGGQSARLSVFAGKTGFTQSVFVASKGA